MSSLNRDQVSVEKMQIKLEKKFPLKAFIKSYHIPKRSVLHTFKSDKKVKHMWAQFILDLDHEDK